MFVKILCVPRTGFVTVGFNNWGIIFLTIFFSLPCHFFSCFLFCHPVIHPSSPPSPSLLVLLSLSSSLPLLQDSSECPSYCAPDSPPPTIQPPPVNTSSPKLAAPPAGRAAVSGAQRRAHALRLGALVAELEKMLQNQSCCEKELRALDHQILHLATILKVSMSTYTSNQIQANLKVLVTVSINWFCTIGSSWPSSWPLKSRLWNQCMNGYEWMNVACMVNWVEL